MTDQQALQQYSEKRDALAFRHLVDQYQRLVYSAARRRLQNAHDIDDVVQLTFLKLAKSSATIQQDGEEAGALASWLYTTTLNNANELIRKDQTRRRHEALAPPPAPSDPTGIADALDQEEWRILSPKIDDALLELPPAERSLIIQHFFQNRSQRDLAQEHRTTAPTIHRRLTRAIESLRQSLRTAGGGGHLPAAPALLGTLHALSQSNVPAPLSAQLTKIGLAGTGGITQHAMAAKSLPWLTSKTALAAAVPLAALMAFLGFELEKSISPGTPPAATPPGAPPLKSPTAASALFPSTPDAYGFRTEDSFPMAATSGVKTMIMNGSGTLFVAQGDDSNNGFVRAKLAGQDRWATIFEAPFLDGRWAHGPEGDLFLQAVAPEPNLGSPMPMYRLPFGGKTFLEVPHDSWTMVKNAIAIAQDGSFYVVGVSGPPTDQRGERRDWFVRKKTPGNGDFVTVDDFLLDPTLPGVIRTPKPGAPDAYIANSVAFALTIVSGTGPSAGIYVVGRCSKGKMEQTHWVVRRSKDGGKSWTTVDDYFSPSEPEFFYLAGTVYADPAGNIYVGGTAGTDGHMHWIVRSSTTGDAGTWSTIDDFSPPGAEESKCYSITTDVAGNLYAAGDVKEPAGTSDHGVIRTNSGGKWHTIEDYCPPAGDAYFNSIVIEPRGRIYVSGLATIAGANYTIVRSAPLPSAQTKNQTAQATGKR